KGERDQVLGAGVGEIDAALVVSVGTRPLALTVKRLLPPRAMTTVPEAAEELEEAALVKVAKVKSRAMLAVATSAASVPTTLRRWEPGRPGAVRELATVRCREPGRPGAVKLLATSLRWECLAVAIGRPSGVEANAS